MFDCSALVTWSDLDQTCTLICITPATFSGCTARVLQLRTAASYFFLESLDSYGMKFSQYHGVNRSPITFSSTSLKMPSPFELLLISTMQLFGAS